MKKRMTIIAGLIACSSVFAAAFCGNDCGELAKISRNGKSVQVAKDGTIVIGVGKETFKYAVGGTTAKLTASASDAIEYLVAATNMPFEVRAKLSFAADGNPELRLMQNANARLRNSQFLYPGALVAQKGDVALIPHGEGLAIPVDDASITLFDNSASLCGGEWQLGLVAVLRGDAWAGAAVENPVETWVKNTRVNGIYNSQLAFLSEKGAWGFDRVVRFVVGDKGGLNKLCADYRAYRDSIKKVATLRDKQKKVANVDKLFGAASFWIWPDEYEKFMYGKDPNAELKPANDDIMRIADELKAGGCERAMIGLFFASNQVLARDIVKRTGYLVHKYDNMEDQLPGHLLPLIPAARIRENDTIERRAKYWPHDTVVNGAGKYNKAWALRGTDGKMHPQNHSCTVFVEKYVREEIPELNKKYGFNAWFFDVMGFGGKACYAKEHPITNRDSIDERRKAFAALADNNLVSGTEEGTEHYVGSYCYTEGKMSPRYCRINYRESGRMKAHLYAPSEYEAQFTKFMLSPQYRIPLWELIYHDCSVNYWYWGDSSNCCPELMPMRDLFNVLYAQPPLYSFHVNEWEMLKPQIMKSVADATVTSRKLGYERMTAFDYLTADRMVQQTTFESGTKVIVNFSDKPVTVKGVAIPAKGYVIRLGLATGKCAW